MKDTVITVDGTEALKTECRKMLGEYYKIGDPKVEGSGQCYQISGKFRREETGYIVYDHTVGEYVLTNDSLIKGVIGFDGNKLIFGHFTAPKYMLQITDVVGSKHFLLNEDIVLNNRKYRYHMFSDSYLHIGLSPAIKFTQLPKVDNKYKQTLTYDSRPVMKSYTKEYEDNDIPISPKVERIAPYLKGLSFGIEFETVAGMVPIRYTKPLGLIPLRDGSISGLEYATIPYEGAKGLQATVESCKMLKRFTSYDDNCSLHLHIGNVPRTEKFFLALFKTLCLIQDEMFELFPLYKKYNFGVKKKNYTQPFPLAKMLSKMDSVITDDNIKENFSVLFEFLSGGQTYAEAGNSLDKIDGHPSDPNGTRKWQIKSRYYWVNLIPLLFGNKATVEFRIHTPTTDINKVTYYLFMCTSIISFVKENTDHILSSKNTHYGDLSYILMQQLRGADCRLLDFILNYVSGRRRSILFDNSQGDIRAKSGISAPNLAIEADYVDPYRDEEDEDHDYDEEDEFDED